VFVVLLEHSQVTDASNSIIFIYNVVARILTVSRIFTHADDSRVSSWHLAASVCVCVCVCVFVCVCPHDRTKTAEIKFPNLG